MPQLAPAVCNLKVPRLKGVKGVSSANSCFRCINDLVNQLVYRGSTQLVERSKLSKICCQIGCKDSDPHMEAFEQKDEEAGIDKIYTSHQASPEANGSLGS